MSEINEDGTPMTKWECESLASSIMKQVHSADLYAGTNGWTILYGQGWQLMIDPTDPLGSHIHALIASEMKVVDPMRPSKRRS